jgi:hypothetical protein
MIVIFCLLWTSVKAGTGLDVLLPHLANVALDAFEYATNRLWILVRPTAKQACARSGRTSSTVSNVRHQARSGQPTS